MTQIREIKCPHCGEWTMWKGQVDDRCFFCDEFLEPQRFSREVEKKVNRELLKENDYLFIKQLRYPWL
jgi:tRNA(Ile2) C34 agmatinyltransferase TiaS